MTLLSKPAKFKWCTPIPATCHELFHTWDQSCTSSIAYVAGRGVLNTIPLYAIFHGIRALLQLRNNKNKTSVLQKYCKNVLRSSLFLGLHGLTFSSLFCLLNRLSGGQTYGEYAFIIGFLSGVFSLWLESKNRRSTLAIYLANISTEIVWNMLISRNIIPIIPNIEIYVFSTSIAAITAFHRLDAVLSPPLKSNIKLVLGETSKFDFLPKMPFLHKTLESFQSSSVMQFKCNGSCNHANGCMHFSLVAGLKHLVIGFGIELLLKSWMILKILSNKRKRFPKFTFSLAKFLSLFIFIYRLSSCCLNYMFSKKLPIFAHLIPGFLAGLSFKYVKSSTVSIYVLLKLIQSLYGYSVAHGWSQNIKHAETLIYGISFGIIFHAMLFEPHNVRKSYYNFLCKISSGKFKVVFRKLADIIGTNASKIDPNFIPPGFHLDKIKSPYTLEILRQSGIKI